MYNRIYILAIAAFAVAVSSATVKSQTLSRGQQILRQRGLQIQAVVIPSAGSLPLDLSVFSQSKFTGAFVIQSDRSIPLSKMLGPAPGIQSGLQLTYGYLNTVEQPYLPNLVSLQMGDEQDITDQVELDAAKNLLTDWRTLYPNAIGYLNQSAGYTSSQVRSYVSYVQPDMLMYDWYPFGGSAVGGAPPENFYNFMQAYRQAGLAGHDGTGQRPIPYGLYLQTFNYNYTGVTMHDPSASEMRLNQFGAWAFGYTYATAFTYLNTTLFSNSSTPLQPAFNEMAETNRQSRNLGPALVRLLSTDVRMVVGQHKVGSSNVNNTRPTTVPAWAAGTAGDPYLIGVSATNVGTVNDGLRGDVIVSHFNPMQGAMDLYFMIVNALTDPNGTVLNAAQRIRLTFNFGTSGINSLQRLSRNTGSVEIVSLIHDSGPFYHVDLTLDGGTGDLFKYNNGLPFVLPIPGDFDADGDVDGADFVIWQTNFPKTSGAGPTAGDADNDGDVDGADFVVWQTHFPSAPGGSAVPEPSGVCLLSGGLALICVRAHSRRRDFWEVKTLEGKRFVCFLENSYR